MSGYVDLHCHFLAEIDDGCRNVEESSLLLQRLSALGFSHVVATPHMRPGMFDNDQFALRGAYRRTTSALRDPARDSTLPITSLGSEHFFDALVFDAIAKGAGLPYRPDDAVEDVGCREGGPILIEFLDLAPMTIIEDQLYRLRSWGYLPVIAHPERYRKVWEEPELVDRLQRGGCVALLDAAALVGKYGTRARETALTLLEDGVYHAACSDSHRPTDTEAVGQAMDLIQRRYGHDELELLFGQGPRELLAGRRPSSL